MKTFHTNLVLLPMVMVYMQYCFIVLGLATVLGVVLLYYRNKVRPLHCICMEGWMGVFVHKLDLYKWL